MHGPATLWRPRRLGRGAQPGCWTRCPALRGDLAIRAVLSGVAGPQEREAGEAAHLGCRAAKIALALQAALVSLHGFLRTPTARLAGAATCPYRLPRTLTQQP